MSNFLVAPRARADLETVRDWIARDSPERAERVLTDLWDTVKELAEHPGLGHRREDLHGSDLLAFVKHKLLIVYRTGPDGIEVVRVLHTHRDIGRAIAE